MIKNLPEVIEKVERVHIKYALKECDWNVQKAARGLNIARSTLKSKMKKYGLWDKTKMVERGRPTRKGAA